MAGFDSAHTAYLARATLARLQQELGMATEDMAMVQREADGSISVQQAVTCDTGMKEISTDWEALANLLFGPESSLGTATETTSEKFATIGIDPAFMKRAVNLNQFRLCKSSLLVRTKDNAQRERVVGVLRGLDGRLARVPLEISEMKSTEMKLTGI